MNMRILLLALLIFLSFSFAQDDLEITRALNLQMSSSCPGNILHVSVIASDGIPVSDVELRLVQYDPYQGLRALKHTNESGETFFELNHPAYYLIYMRLVNDTYNHPDYFEYNYSSLCPPPPPRQMSVSIMKDCKTMTLALSIFSSNGSVAGALVTSPEWSSLSNDRGIAIIPFKEGDALLRIEKSGFASVNISERILCSGCLADYDCADNERCDNESSSCVPVNISGGCGYAWNHAWYPYQCCEDADCGNVSTCQDNSCVVVPSTPPIIMNQTNGLIQNGTNSNGTIANLNNTNTAGANGTGATGAGGGICGASALLFAIAAIYSCFIIFLHKRQPF
jgi:hypothetical protein